MKINIKTGIKIGVLITCAAVACIYFNLVKAPMIVVQGSIQLWPVTITNNTTLTLVVIDEIIDPLGSSHIVRYLPSTTPNNQFTFQWPSTTEKPNARKITIYGRKHAVLPTNKIIIGNTPDATHPAVPSGDFSIINSVIGATRQTNSICIADKLNPSQCSGR
jgi:hypothetical protein